MTSLFADLNNWPGRLLEATDGATIVAKTATNFTFRYPASHDFANYLIVVQGTGFSYDGSEPIDGRMTQVRIFDSTGAVVITFANLQTNPFSADFAQFYSNVFGSGNSDAGPGPDGKTAWAHLLSGNDIINGTAFNDNRGLVGLDFGNDTYNMGAGDDYVNGGMGNDTYNGGDGFDTLTFVETTFNEGAPAFRGATFNIAQNRVLDPWGGTDVISGFERYEGSRFDDVYNGSSERDRFSGLRGRDTIDGGDNSFDSIGNLTDDHRDEVSYAGDYWQGGFKGIRVNLETSLVNGSITGTVRDGFGNLDTVIDIERVSGTRYADTFVGSRTNNHFWGGEGKDTFNGADGFDTLRMDRWFADTPIGNVSVDLSLATNQVLNDGFGNVEVALNMEAVTAGSGNDTLKGNRFDNYIEGGQGADIMTGGGGLDSFGWWETAQLGQGDRVTDFNINQDRFEFEVAGFQNMTTTLSLVNGTAATTVGLGTFVFNTVNDTLYWDADGAGGAAALAVVQLNNISNLSASNFDLY
ncbi:MAG: hypothetical protein CFE33_09330 [Pseudorhodobacter sp. PARRP1]|nr:MAG: hypothetical protein CFE33_09330 [Pseudorhodobacter sp. PARRP1]